MVPLARVRYNAGACGVDRLPRSCQTHQRRENELEEPLFVLYIFHRSATQKKRTAGQPASFNVAFLALVHVSWETPSSVELMSELCSFRNVLGCRTCREGATHPFRMRPLGNLRYVERNASASRSYRNSSSSVHMNAENISRPCIVHLCWTGGKTSVWSFADEGRTCEAGGSKSTLT